MGIDLQNQAEGQYLHIQSYLCRKSMLNLLEQSQGKEHAFLTSIEVLTDKHTNKVLDAIVDWLEVGCKNDNHDEIASVSELSGINISDWLLVKDSITRNNFDIGQCVSEIASKDAHLQSLSPWKNKIFGSDAEKAQIKVATEALDKAKHKKDSLEKAKESDESKAKEMALTILKNMCSNMQSLEGSDGLAGDIKQISEQSMGEVMREISVHEESQLSLIAELERQVVLLKSFYCRGVA